MNKAYFPEHIFDGTHDKRTTLQEVRPPDYDDYIRLYREIQETQNFLLNKLENLQKVPDVLGLLQTVHQKAEKIEKKLKKSTIPEELDAYIKNVESKLEQSLEETKRLQRLLAKTSLEYSELEERIKIIEDGWQTDVTGFQKYNRGEYARFRQSVKDDLDALKKQILALKDILGS